MYDLLACSFDSKYLRKSAVFNKRKHFGKSNDNKKKKRKRGKKNRKGM